MKLKDITCRTRCWVFTVVLSIPITRILSIKSFKQVDVPTAFSDISQPLGQACSWDPSWHKSSRSVLVKNWNRCWASVLHGYLIITKFKKIKNKLLSLLFFFAKNPIFRMVSLQKKMFFFFVFLFGAIVYFVVFLYRQEVKPCYYTHRAASKNLPQGKTRCSNNEYSLHMLRKDVA